MLSRQMFVSAAAACAAATLLPRPARSQATKPLVDLRMLGAPVDVGANCYYAKEAGIFEKHGINPIFVNNLTGPGAAAAVIGGSLEIGQSDLTSLFNAHVKQLPLVLVAPDGAYRSSAPTAAFLVLKNSPIASPRDLVGKTVAVAALHSLSTVEIYTWMTSAGLKKDDVKMIEVPFTSMDAALTSGRVDVIYGEEPLISLNADHTRILGRPADAVGKQFLEVGYFVSVEFARNRPDVVKAFADAIAETNAWANTHHDETFAILNKMWKSRLPTTMARCYFPERLRVSDVQPLIDATAAVGQIDKRFPARELFAPGIPVG